VYEIRFTTLKRDSILDFAYGVNNRVKQNFWTSAQKESKLCLR